MTAGPIPISVAVAAAVGLTCALLVHLWARRSVAHAVAWSPLTAVITIASGIATGSHYMVAPGPPTILSVIAATSPIALATGWIVSRRVNEAMLARERQVEETRRLQSIDAARLELVTWMSHDLRSPLAGIRAMAEAIEDGVAARPQDYLRSICAETNRMNDMLTDLLEFAKMTGPHLVVGREAVALGDVVSDCVERVEVIASGRGVQVSGEVSGDVLVCGDAGLLTRAADNMIRNAVVYTRPGTSVAIEVRGESERVNIRVSDTCGGVSPTEARDAFVVGWRKDPARTPGDGSGLGLPIARAIARAHGGDVTMTPIPGGCEVVLWVPRGDAAQPES